MSDVTKMRRVHSYSRTLERDKQDATKQKPKVAAKNNSGSTMNTNLKVPRLALISFVIFQFQRNALIGHAFSTGGTSAPCRNVKAQFIKPDHVKLTKLNIINQTVHSSGKRRRVTKRVSFAAMVLIGALTSHAPQAFAAQKASTLPVSLGLKQLLVGSALVSTFGGVFLEKMGLSQLAQDILSAAARASAQLFLLGGFILQGLFGTTKPAIVWTWILGVGILAAQEAFSRVEYTYSKLKRHITFSVLVSGIGILALSLAGKVFGDIQPWYQPRTLIPVAGMLFGNTLSATSLAAASLTREFATSSSQVDLRLARGADSHEATMPIIKTSLYSALTPTVNSLAATGIIHMPGMMTGQVLAGQSPSQAAAYQVLILFLITSTACSTVQLLATLVSHELIDWKDDRLQTSELVRVASTKSKEVRFSFRTPLNSTKSTVSSWFTSPPAAIPIDQDAKIESSLSSPSVVPISSSVALKGFRPVLTVDNVRVQRANVQVTFNLVPGERIGITGPSGIGKTQVLRTLAGLERVEGQMKLHGESCRDLKWPEWRRNVCWVSQDRTTLDGTPRDFYAEVKRYHTQSGMEHTKVPEDIAASWGLPASAFDRPWATLSGGEASRASLAIALTFDPQVLLLDEVTAGLDEDTALAVEETLASSNVPIVMVTHSRAQLDRFCTHQLDLGKGVPVNV